MATGDTAVYEPMGEDRALTPTLTYTQSAADVCLCAKTQQAGSLARLARTRFCRLNRMFLVATQLKGI